MYRDSANALDERDRAVGAILIGEALVDECQRAATLIRTSETLSHNERWRTITDVHDTYPEIWRHLDRARSVLATRGANTARYDEMRPNARRAPTNAEGTDIDKAAIDDARRAIEDLKLAVPGADWNAINERTTHLLDKPLARAKGQRAIVLSMIVLFVFAITGWAISIIPERKVSRHELMRRELSEIAQTRKLRIEIVRVELGQRCDLERARELAKLLAMDGRTIEANSFGLDYLSRCGDDEIVDNWAHAPRPPRSE
ncbi:MAG TPA: hypothetical protein VFV99_09950 [Kofleriaceae bacterium]|nr:hypothetical protein [Kofleriaceae bacterium]